MTRDYALTEDPAGGVLLHRYDCPYARKLAEAGEPVITLFQCQGEMPKNLKRHTCMEEKKNK